MDGSKKSKLRSEAQNIKPTVSIGKNGITSSVIEEIRSQLHVRRLIKVHMLRAYLAEGSVDDVIYDIRSSIRDVTVVDKRGHTVVLYK